MARTIPDPRPRAKVLDLAVALLCCPKPKTLTAALSWLEESNPSWKDQDWSDDYRLWSKTQWSLEELFFPLLFEAVALSPPAPRPLYSAQDDTLIRKTGRRLPGTSILRDPLSPPFHVNLVLGQRFLQTSVLLPTGGTDRPWRSIPVRFRHTPPLKARRGASPEEKAAVRLQRKKHNLCVSAAQELQALRQDIDQLPNGPDRLLIHAVDGGYANKTFLGQLPPRTQVVARIRKDAKLRAVLPEEQKQGSRKYGAPLPTPEQYLQDDQIPWQSLRLFVAGQERTLYYKQIGPLCWPKGTGDRPVSLIVIKPAGYRLRKGSRLLYRQPAFLLNTAPELPVELLIEAYLARWEVEVNFRDEKHGLGVGQAQVWNSQAVARAPAFLVACYSALLLSSIRVFQDRRSEAFGRLPRWRKTVPLRPSLQDLIRLLTKETKADFLTLSPAVAA
jgi:hypothetical protein